MKLSYADMPNLEKLFEVILSASRAPQRYIRVLTNDEFTRRFIEGRKDLANIEVSKDLFSALEGLLSEFTGEYELGEKKIELAGERVLQAEAGPEGEAVHLKFQTEKKRALTSIEERRDFLQGLKIAVVDDDPIIQQLIKTTFEKGGAMVYAYSDGQEFMEALKKETFDLIFLDLLMPRIDGFGVLQRLKSADLGIPVIVLSAVSQRNTVIKAFQAGSKSYLIKPLKPLDIITKTLEILRPGV
jgi:CheY-like chemotaxis protein